MAIPAPVGREHCVRALTQFVMDQEMTWISGRISTVRDPQGRVVFIEKRKAITNASGQQVASVGRKLFSIPAKWKAYSGNSLVFTMAASAIFQWKSSYDIFLPGNSSSSPDFSVKGDASEHNFTVRYGDTVIAQVERKGKRDSIFARTDKYTILVEQGVDYAFIVFIVIIIEKIREAHRQAAQSGGG